MIDPTTRDAYAKRVGSLCSDCSVLTASVLSDINQVFYGNGLEGNLSATNLSVRYVTGQEYHDLVTGASGQFEPKTLYVVSSDQINAYNIQIKNVGDPEEEKDAANKWYVDYACESALTIVEEIIDEDLHNYYKQSETSSSSEISAAFEDALSADVVKIGNDASVPPQTNTVGQVRSIAIGLRADANDSAADGNAQGVAIGPDTIAAEASTAVGSQANASNDKCVAVGYQANASGTHGSSNEENIESTAVGCLAQASGQQSTCIGSQSQATGSMSVALGKGAKATGDLGIASGNGSVAAQEGISIGLNAKTATRGVSIGSSANNGNPQPRAVSIGNNSKASADGATALGYNTNATGRGSVAIGAGFVNDGSGTYKSSAQALNNYSIAIGQGAIASADDAVQIGRGTNLSSGTLQFKDYMIIDSVGKIPAERLNINSISNDLSIVNGSLVITSGDITQKDGSFAGGKESVISGNNAFAFGYQTSAFGKASHAAGVKANAEDDYSFVWSAISSTEKASNGLGTFSIYPVDGISGFYIGLSSLNDYLNNSQGNVEDYVKNSLKSTLSAIESNPTLSELRNSSDIIDVISATVAIRDMLSALYQIVNN